MSTKNPDFSAWPPSAAKISLVSLTNETNPSEALQIRAFQDV